MVVIVMKYVINPEQGISDFYYCENLKNPTAPPHVHSHIEFAYITDGLLSIGIGENNFEFKNKNCGSAHERTDLHRHLSFTWNRLNFAFTFHVYS